MNSQGVSATREPFKHGQNCYRTNVHPIDRMEALKTSAQELLQESREFGKIVTIENLQLGKGQTIRARVCIKSDQHLFYNAYGQGTMATVDLIDSTGEIRITAFGDCVKFFDAVEVDRVYYYSNFTVNVSRNKPGTIQVNKLELHCNNETVIVREVNRDDDVPHLSFNFEPLEIIDSKKRYDVIDIIAICQSCGPVQDVFLKNNVQGKKRELILVDQSKEVMMTIWGTNAESFENVCTPGCAIAFKRARVTLYGGETLDSSCLSSSTFKVDPYILEAFTLRYWFESLNEN